MDTHLASPTAEAPMTVLHIEHPITDFDRWAAAFAAMADKRVHAGVRAEHITRPTDDPHYVVIDLDFDDPGAAKQFLGFLENQVWAIPQNSPALSGRPTTRLLERVEYDTPSQVAGQ